jgi:threonine/homoserine/homoserine lactone efflux protein
LLNSKSAVLYTALLPQFIPEGAPLLPNLVLLAAINTVLALTWFCLCVVALDWLQRRLGAALRWIERASGLLLLALCVRVAVTK